jgi:DNA replication protein DnaC
MPTLERLHFHLQALTLAEADAVLEAHLKRAAKQERPYSDFLVDLLQAEYDARRSRRISTRLNMAHLPYHKTLAHFDLAFQPSIDKRQLQDLQTLRFVHEASNVIFLGPPGVGKTHLAVALAIEAVEAGHSAYCVTAHELVSDAVTTLQIAYLPWMYSCDRSISGCLSGHCVGPPRARSISFCETAWRGS